MATLAPFDVQDIETSEVLDGLKDAMKRQLRFEAAKTLLGAILSDPTSHLRKDAEHVEHAVTLADLLMERLEK